MKPVDKVIYPFLGFTWNSLNFFDTQEAFHNFMSRLAVEKVLLGIFYEESYQNNFHQGKVISQWGFIIHLV